MSRSPKLDGVTVPADLHAAITAEAARRGQRLSTFVQEALAAHLGRPIGPTAADVVAALSKDGLSSPAVERAVRRVMGEPAPGPDALTVACGRCFAKVGRACMSGATARAPHAERIAASLRVEIEPPGVTLTNEPPIGEPEALRRKVYVKGARR